MNEELVRRRALTPPLPQAGEGAHSLLPLVGEGGPKGRMRAIRPPPLPRS